MDANILLPFARAADHVMRTACLLEVTPAGFVLDEREYAARPIRVDATLRGESREAVRFEFPRETAARLFSVLTGEAPTDEADDPADAARELVEQIAARVAQQSNRSLRLERPVTVAREGGVAHAGPAIRCETDAGPFLIALAARDEPEGTCTR
jgi:CheY-specific phosphatase CheX